MKVGIVGYGWIGKATQKLFPNAQVYDKYIEGYTKPLENCDIAFLAVPTPWNQGDGLDCSAVEDAIATCGCDFIVIRSATQPGFADEMVKRYKKRIVVQPEYLGETPNHPFLQMDARQFMIIGGDAEDRRKVIECYQQAYNANVTIRQVTRYEAEIINPCCFACIIQFLTLHNLIKDSAIFFSMTQTLTRQPGPVNFISFMTA